MNHLAIRVMLYIITALKWIDESCPLMMCLFRAIPVRRESNAKQHLEASYPTYSLTPFDSEEAYWLLPCPRVGSICIFQIDPFVALDVHE